MIADQFTPPASIQQSLHGLAGDAESRAAPLWPTWDIHRHVLLCAAWFLTALTWAVLAPWLGLAPPWIMEPLRFLAPLITGLLILLTFARAMRLIMRTGDPMLTLPYALTQVFLFLLLFLQIYAHLGAGHYSWEGSPAWYDWPIMTLAHSLRAVDALDLLEAYGLSLQNIHHNSLLVGFCLTVFHLFVDLFLLGIIVAVVFNRGSVVEQFALELQVLVYAFPVLWLGTALWQGWRWEDYLLWPLDNFLHVIDFADVLVLSGTCLHEVKGSLWTGTLSFALRIMILLTLAESLRRVSHVARLRWMGGLGLTLEQLEDIAQHHHSESVRRCAEERLAALHATSQDTGTSRECWSWKKLGRSLSSQQWSIGAGVVTLLLIVTISYSSWSNAAEQLAETATDPGSPKADRAFRALRRIGSPARSASRRLAEAYPELPERQQLAVLSTLGHLGGVDAIELLTDEAHSSDDVKARRSVESLGLIGPETAPVLARVAYHSHLAKIRQLANDTVLNKGDEAVPVLFAALHNDFDKKAHETFKNERKEEFKAHPEFARLPPVNGCTQANAHQGIAGIARH